MPAVSPPPSDALNDALAAAALQGIISTQQAEKLGPFLQSAGLAKRDVPAATAAEPIDDGEQPRFVRGFHDILITIGVIVALTGILGVATIYAVIPAIILLSEILVRRQRLALPAVTLTIALGLAAVSLAVIHLDDFDGAWNDYASALTTTVILPLVMAPYYWRYRIPLSLAALLLGLYAVAVLGIFTVFSMLTGSADLLTDQRIAALSILLLAALGLFATATAYDLSDPARITRRSDIAFWLHLATAPALLYALLAFVFVRSGSADWWSGEMSVQDAAAVLVVVGALMLTGLIIDRRAFVTSGLVSLGLALWAILNRSIANVDSYIYAIVLAVGVIVLSIGIFWRPLRRLVLSPLPDAWRARLHPVR